MATQYIVPPQYRSGQGDPALAKGMDYLTFLSYLTKLNEAKDAKRLEDVEYYTRELDRIRSTKATERRAEGRQKSKELRDLAKDIESEKRNIKTLYGDKNFDTVTDMGAAQFKINLEDDAHIKQEIRQHNKAMTTDYRIEDLVMDAQGYYQTNPGVLTKSLREQASSAMQQATGLYLPYDTNPGSDYQGMMEAFHYGSTTVGPAKYAGDPYPTKFAGVEDLGEDVKSLATLVTESLTESDVEKAYRAGINANKGWMTGAEAEGLAHQSLLAKKYKEELRTGADAERAAKLTKADGRINELFTDFWNDSFSGDDKIVETRTGLLNIIDGLPSHLQHASRFLFFLGDNILEPGSDPTTYPDADEFIGKFQHLNKPGRGGAPSITEQVYDRLNFDSEYARINSMVEGKDPELPPEIFKEAMYSADVISDYYDTKPSSTLDPYQRDIWGIQYSDKFLNLFDSSAEEGNLKFDYNRQTRTPSIHFNTGAEANSFMNQMAQRMEKFPPESALHQDWFHFLGQIGDGAIQITHPK